MAKPAMSPVLTWDPFRDASRPPTRRPLTPAELGRARDRANRFYDLLKTIPVFNASTTHVTLAEAWPLVDESGAIRDQFYVYWSRPGDVRRRPDGSFLAEMGGSHLILFVDTNRPLGALLDGEIARYRKEIAALDQGTKRSLEQLEASMTPAAKAARRVLRAERWKAQYRTPDSLTRELDNADKSDEADYQRQKERLSPPAALAGGTCVPMVRIRRDLVDPKRPGDVQMVNFWFS